MKISIITVSLNSVHTIRGTIQSVLNQNYPNIEFIVVDGSSQDGTVEIIKSYKNIIDQYISEPDDGIYDAMNKGIRMATGDVIGILNSDDIYADYDILSKVAYTFYKQGVDSVYGDLCYVAEDNPFRITRYWKSGVYRKSKFLKGWMVPHPTFFVRREVYEKYGLFDPSFRFAGDYELILRLLYKNDISTYYIPQVMVVMRMGGVSNGSFSNRLKANAEDKLAWKLNHLSRPFYTTWLKPALKIPQFVKYPKGINFFPIHSSPLIKQY